MKSESDNRTLEQLKHHYEVEKELASVLRASDREARQALYGTLYDELFQKVPHHPQLQQKSNEDQKNIRVDSQLALLNHYLTRDTVFLEIGPGDCALSFRVASLVKKVIGVDVSNEITKSGDMPSNFELLLTVGSNIDVPESSVDLAYSDQLIEHLHPEDAVEHLENVFRALRPNGKYICITPNRVSGPHDISRYFDEYATGFHLKEYTNKELTDIFKRVGFSEVKHVNTIKGKYFSLPLGFPFVAEKFVALLPFKYRRPLAKSFPMRKIVGLKLLGIK